MKADLYTASVVVFNRGLAGLDTVLGKAAAHAEANDLDLAGLLRARLYPDMYPLYRQVQIACDFARQTPARIAGLDVPPNLTGEPDFEELRTRVSETKQFLDGLTPAQFEGRDDIMVSFPVGRDTMTLEAAQFLLAVAVQNFFFHFVTAYAILRMSGVPVGKWDYFGMPQPG